MLENIAYAADALETVNTRLTVEPVNTRTRVAFVVERRRDARVVAVAYPVPDHL